MEKPIITTNSVGCKEVVENEKNGFLVPIKNSAALADAMIKMIELPYEKRLEMGKYGREKILIEFDEKIVIDKYLKTIEGLMSL
jgi:glycosyltransferase involved in cell wall biosynthesis